jgi:hypothetical protein
VIERFGDRYPAVMACHANDLERLKPEIAEQNP